MFKFSLKYQLLKFLHKIKHLKNSESFFNDLFYDLTKHDKQEQYNILGNLLVYCKKDQIINLLSHLSINRFEQIDRSSSFYFKLIRYQPIILIHLIKQDLNHFKLNKEKFSKYFQEKEDLFKLLTYKVTKELIYLTIEYLNQLEKHKRFIPEFIQSKQKYFFKKFPLEMIQLIEIVAATIPGFRFIYFNKLI